MRIEDFTIIACDRCGQEFSQTVNEKPETRCWTCRKDLGLVPPLGRHSFMGYRMSREDEGCVVCLHPREHDLHRRSA